MRTGFTVSAVLATGALLLSVASPAVSDNVAVRLGALNAGGHSTATAVNDAGQAVGNSSTGRAGLGHAVLFEDGALRDLGALAGTDSSVANDVNEAGDVVGFSEHPNGTRFACVFRNGTVEALPGIGHTYTHATGINNTGQICGFSASGNGVWRALLWTNGVVRNLGSIPGHGGYSIIAEDVNDAGQVVGVADGLPFIWQNGTMRALELLPGSFAGGAFAINQSGQACGYVDFGSSQVAVLWDAAGRIRSLGTLAGNRSYAYGLNDAGQVVGASNVAVNGPQHAFVWQDGAMADLGMMPGGVATFGRDINNNGLAVGYGTETLGGSPRAVRFAVVSPDRTAPATTCALDRSPAGGWFDGAVTASLSATDNAGGSGVSATYYSLDGAPQQTYSAPVTVSGNGLHSLAFWSIDKAGNVETRQERTIRIDRVAPSTSGALDRSPGAAGWFSGSVDLTLTASDNAGGSGVTATHVSLDGAAAQSYSTPIAIAGDGVHTVAFWSVDAAGNQESRQEIAVRIDGTGPTLTAATGDGQLWPPNGKLVPVTVSGTVTDAASGVATGTYQVVDEYGQVQPQGTLVIAADGTYSFTVQLEARRSGDDRDGRTYTIVVRAADRAGNSVSAQTTAVVVHDQRK